MSGFDERRIGGAPVREAPAPEAESSGVKPLRMSRITPNIPALLRLFQMVRGSLPFSKSNRGQDGLPIEEVHIISQEVETPFGNLPVGAVAVFRREDMDRFAQQRTEELTGERVNARMSRRAADIWAKIRTQNPEGGFV